MTIQFKESNKYLLDFSIFNRAILHCISIQDGIAYLEDQSKGHFWLNDNYKVVLKTGKLYKWNDRFKSWDNVVDGKLTEYGVPTNVSTGVSTKVETV